MHLEGRTIFAAGDAPGVLRRTVDPIARGGGCGALGDAALTQHVAGAHARNGEGVRLDGARRVAAK